MDTAIDPALVLRGLGIDDAAEIKPVSGGNDTAIWRVRVKDRDFALRVFRPEQEGTLLYEAAAMSAAAHSGATVPSVHARGIVDGRPAMLISWCEGAPMLQAVVGNPQSARSLGSEFGRMHARLHRVAAPPALRERRSNVLGWYGDVDPAVLERLQAMNLRTDVLLHMDYHPLNVMAHNGAVAGVIDWTNAHAGDPRLDVARSVTILRITPFADPLERAGFRKAGRVIVDGYLDGYQQEAGPLGDMAPFYAWAGEILRKDWAYKIGRPGMAITEQHLAPARRWVAAWKWRMNT